MSNYTKTTNFATKDALPSGNPAKIVKGTEIDTEFNNIATAVATKANTADPTFTGTVTLPVTNADSLSIGGDGVTVTGIKDEDDMASNSATKLASQQSIKAYVDSQVTAQDLDVTDGTTSISIDLDSEALSLLGGTGIDSTASGNGVTMAIDSTVATLTGTQTLTNKTLTSPDVNTPDIDGGTIDGTVIGGTTAAAGSFTTVGATGNITVGGTVDGRDVATDGTKLDTVETNADVTDTVNVTAAGALMDSEVTNLAQVKAFDSTDYATAAQGTTADAALPRTGGAMTGPITTTSTFDGRDVATDGTKLDGIEALADVTDTANVTAAGALMDSELTSIASVKALDQGVATTDSPTFAAATVTGEITANGGIALGDNDKATFGASDDLQIYHDGSSRIANSTGNLIISDTDGDIYIQAKAGENSIRANNDGSVLVYFDNAEKLATTSTGIDVTGTATMDGLTVGSASGVFPSEVLQIRGNGGTSGYVNGFGLGASNAQFRIFADDTNNTAGSIKFDIRNRDRILIEDSGDISFYEDTGTTPKFFWDASAESLGIGTSSPVTTLTASNTTQNDALGIAQVVNTTADDVSSSTMTVKNHSGTGQFMQWRTFGMRIGSRIITNNGVGDVAFTVGNDSEAMRLTSTGLGIGTSSPTALLHLSSTAPSILMQDSDGTGRSSINCDNGSLNFKFNSNNAVGTSVLTFSDFNTERLRIDSSGNVGIGTSTNRLGEKLHVLGNGIVTSSAENTNMGMFGTFGGSELIVGAFNNIPVVFRQNNTERMRIDSSGNLLVGKTASSFTTAGVELAQGGTAGKVQIMRASGGLTVVNTADDGAAISVYKGTTAVGSIGSVSGVTIGIDGGGGRAGLQLNSGYLGPRNGGALTDNAVDLGATGSRFKDLYLSGGVYQNGTRLTKRTSPSSGGSGIFASITNAPQTGFVHIYETGTDKYLILACFKKDTSSTPVTNVVANNGLTVNATNAGGTIAIGGHTSSGNVKMQATIIREA